MADDKFHAIANELVGNRNALLGIGNVVALFDFDLLPENTARLVEVLGGLADAVLRGDLALGAADVMNDHRAALGGQPARHSLAEAFSPAGACDDRDFSA